MANIRTALDAAIALRAALETDTAVRPTIVELCDRAILLLVGTRQFAEGGGPLLAYQYKKLSEQIAFITYILRRALSLLARIREERVLTRVYDGADLSPDAQHLTCELSRAASSIQGLLSTRLLDIAAQNRSTLEDLHDTVANALQHGLANPDRSRTGSSSSQASHGEHLTPSGSGVLTNDVQRVYLEQKISLLAESLLVAQLGSAKPVPTPTTVEWSPVSPRGTGRPDGGKQAEHVAETFELLDSLRSSLTPFELADRLRALFLGVAAHFDLSEAALSIVKVEIGIRRRLLLADSSKQSIIMLIRSLLHLSLAYTRLDRPDDSVVAVEEADILLRGLMANEPPSGPTETRLLFAEHLLGRGVRLYGSGKFKDALANCEEAEQQWSLAMRGAGARSGSLATCVLRALVVRCALLHAMDRFEESAPALVGMREHATRLCSTESARTDAETMFCGLMVLAALARTLAPPDSLQLAGLVEQAISNVPDCNVPNVLSLKSAVWFTISHVYMEAGQLDASLAAIQTAIDLRTPEVEGPGTSSADEVIYWMWIHYATILFRLGDWSGCREVLTKVFRMFDQLDPNRRTLFAANLADALELSAALRSREDPHRGTQREMEMELEKAAMCWQEMTGEMELRAGKGLTRVSAALWELRNGSVSPQEFCPSVKAPREKDTHRKWKQKLAGRLKQVEGRLRSR